MLNFLACILITVFVHELAHMLVALKCGMGVKAFAIGFGKPFLHKTIKGIDYRLCPLPLGGYCDIQGMDSKESDKDFLSHPYYQKFLVLVAGAVTNLVLALIVYLVHYGSVSIGLKIDWICLKAMFTQDYNELLYIARFVPINLFLLQLSVFNLFCGITNLLPLIPLDGGLIWYYIIESKLSKGFKKFLFVSGWILVIGLQLGVLFWIYFK